MATAAQKITLASARDIPFHKLVLSQANVRQIKAGVSVEELAASIVRRGLIQSLHVRPVLDGEGQETGMFEVPAGGRRYRVEAYEAAGGGVLRDLFESDDGGWLQDIGLLDRLVSRGSAR